MNAATFYLETNQQTQQNIQHELNQYASYALADLKEASLMNRVDSKFMLPLQHLPNLLASLNTAYRVLDIEGRRIFTYRNRYYDTAPLQFYHDHHNGKLERFKVRHRHYTDTDTSYLEVKRKTNQKRTLKQRINQGLPIQGNKNADTFIHNTVGIDPQKLIVTQHSGYNRIALANEASAERVTIDFNLWYSEDGETKIHLPNTCIVELKQKRKTKRSPLLSSDNASRLKRTKFSKYCIGCALLYKDLIKTNQFKETISRIQTANEMCLSQA